MTDQHVACELSAPSESTAPTAPVARPRVLVIDDEAAIRSAFGRALDAEGLVTDLAGTAAEGLSRARADVYDLVILDLLMPGTDGLAVLRQIAGGMNVLGRPEFTRQARSPFPGSRSRRRPRT